MALLITLQGPESGRKYSLDQQVVIIGRQSDSAICLPPKAVSRQHAQILKTDQGFLVEDLKSSNGTFLNGRRLEAHEKVALTERDSLQIGPYVFGLRQSPTLTTTEPNLVIREQVNAVTLNQSVYGHDPAQKLQVVLEIAQHLGRTLDLEQLLDKLLDHLMRLFAHADRGMVLLCEEDRLVVRGQRSRRDEDATTYPYSRTIVNKALKDGIGILSDDVQGDKRFQTSATITSLDLHSLLCVPLIGQDGRRIGVIQLDRFRPGLPFRSEDLHLLTTISLQVAVVLENAALHAELLRKERQDQELALAREIQQGFLPTDFDDFEKSGFELYACVHPARQVSGDLYDFFPLSGGRLAFFVGDVSGKGMPAALFMVAVHTLSRHLAANADSPARTLAKMNDALAADNAAGLFVTLVHGIYHPPTGQVVLSSAGHPLPLIRHPDGRVEELDHRTGRLLGYEGGDLNLTDARFTLGPNQTMVLYTDGFTEARAPDGRTMYGMERLEKLISEFDGSTALAACADRAKAAVDQFTRSKEQQDDLTLLLLRRTGTSVK
jgi:serine phosphatase RsbU (regulator of sigma subunit)/pSer/pThr/pTyr-binding forkhead associated (FHA) protein